MSRFSIALADKSAAGAMDPVRIVVKRIHFHTQKPVLQTLPAKHRVNAAGKRIKVIGSGLVKLKSLKRFSPFEGFKTAKRLSVLAVLMIFVLFPLKGFCFDFCFLAGPFHSQANKITCSPTEQKTAYNNNPVFFSQQPTDDSRTARCVIHGLAALLLGFCIGFSIILILSFLESVTESFIRFLKYCMFHKKSNNRKRK